MGMLSSLLRRASRRRGYANLLELDDRLLRDIGISRGDVHQMMRGRIAPSQARTHE